MARRRVWHNTELHPDVSVARVALERFFEPPLRPHVARVLEALVQARLLLPGGDADYWFCIPSGSAFLAGLLSGRKELAGVFKRKKYRELLREELLALALKTTPLPVDFLVQDLMGADVVTVSDTTAGKLYRLATA